MTSTTSERAARPMAQRLPDRLLTTGDAEDILAACGYRDEIADCALRAAVRDGWFRLGRIGGHLVEHSPGRDDDGSWYLIRSMNTPDVFRATVSAAYPGGLTAAAIALAVNVYGTGANLRVEDVSALWNRPGRDEVSAEVTVRCLDFDWGQL